MVHAFPASFALHYIDFLCPFVMAPASECQRLSSFAYFVPFVFISLPGGMKLRDVC